MCLGGGGAKGRASPRAAIEVCVSMWFQGGRNSDRCPVKGGAARVPGDPERGLAGTVRTKGQERSHPSGRQVMCVEGAVPIWRERGERKMAKRIGKREEIKMKSLT